MVAVGADHRAGERAAGFRSGIQNAGAHLEEFVLTERPNPTLGSKALAALMDRTPSPQAIFFSNDVLCLGGLFEVQRRGLKIPDDVRLCGYGDQDFTSASTPSLSSVRPPDRAVGRRTAEMLLERFEGNHEPVAIDLGYELHRSTIGLVARGKRALPISRTYADMTAKASTDRPNVLLITVDQWPGRTLGCAGHPAIETPTLNRLAHLGVRYTRAYSECPICIPARRTLHDRDARREYTAIGHFSRRWQCRA